MRNRYLAQNVGQDRHNENIRRYLLGDLFVFEWDFPKKWPRLSVWPRHVILLSVWIRSMDRN